MFFIVVVFGGVGVYPMSVSMQLRIKELEVFHILVAVFSIME